jgi:hypothetical protein
LVEGEEEDCEPEVGAHEAPPHQGGPIAQWYKSGTTSRASAYSRFSTGSSGADTARSYASGGVSSSVGGSSVGASSVSSSVSITSASRVSVGVGRPARRSSLCRDSPPAMGGGGGGGGDSGSILRLTGVRVVGGPGPEPLVPASLHLG